MSDVWIVNASPLIFLGNANHLDLLHSVADRHVLVPDAVYEEVVFGGYSDGAARNVENASWLEKTAPLVIPPSIVEWDLGLGESAVIAEGLKHIQATVVIDDLLGRKCALSQGLRVMGTVGVVVTAYRSGHIADPRRVLNELRTAGMWLSDAVLLRALQIAGIDPAEEGVEKKI